jgi:hypothetical protein
VLLSFDTPTQKLHHFPWNSPFRVQEQSQAWSEASQAAQGPAVGTLPSAGLPPIYTSGLFLKAAFPEAEQRPQLLPNY